MSNLSRVLVRCAATSALLATFIGLPLLLVVGLGVRSPSWSLIRDAWVHRHMSTDLIIAIGVGVFIVLWMWFAITALTELMLVRAWRRGDRTEPLPVVASGPGRWVRALIRVAALSALGMAALPSDALSPSWGAIDASAAASMTVDGRSDLADPVGPPGGTGAPSVAPAPDATARGRDWSTPFATGLGVAVLVCGGALSALESNRRRQWRATHIGHRLATPTLAQARTEMMIRSIGATERLARLDLAVRSAGRALADQGAAVSAAVVDDEGAVTLHLTHPVRPVNGSYWTTARSATADIWTLPASVPLEALARGARGVAQPCPALVHLGRARGGGSAPSAASGEVIPHAGPAWDADLYVDLEAVCALSVLTPDSDAILRSLAAALALSPFLSAATVHTVGLDAQRDIGRSEQVDTLDAALDAAFMAIGSTARQQMRTFSLRVGSMSSGGEIWPPALVVSARRDLSPTLVDDLAMVGGGHGIGFASDRPVTSSPWVVRRDGDAHVLEPLGIRFVPVGLDAAALTSVADLVEASERSIGTSPEHPFAPLSGLQGPAASVTVFEEPRWRIMVRVLGPVEVVSDEGVPVVFERSKALELVVWLSQHRSRPTRASARTALWDTEVRDATFANVVSDARRALARTVQPPTGEEWIGRTLSEDLPLHGAVITDAELLAARVASARTLPRAAAIEVLRPGVELLGGLPFAGTSFLWTDAEGITSSLVVLAVSAATELATLLLEDDDLEGVFWATGQGLKVLAGHEALIGLRMRAHARQGDLAGVRAEWESYERALAADPWAAAAPAPKLVSLRAHLLAPTPTRS